jgi:sugar O-acyltransferase (sialic acid O-acetyltransferase NeuD family)
VREKLILIGGGGHCKSCIDVIEQEDKFDIVGIVDRFERIGEKFLGYEIIASDSEIIHLANSYKYFFVTIGGINSFEPRIKLFSLLKELKIHLPRIISPLAYVSRYAKIGEGTIVMHDVIINADAIIGNFCIINTKALIEHDVIIGDHCHISTGAIINGGVKIGNNTFFGSGAVSKQYIIIPENSFIKANSIIK